MSLNIRFVLVNTSHPGNIGASARAIKTMGFSQFYLVNPKLFPHHQATEMAAGADDLLEQAVVVEELADAIKDCHLIIGATARDRGVPLPVLTPKQCGELAVTEATMRGENAESDSFKRRIAIIFGCERVGLTNEQLMLCHHQVTIPTGDIYKSLNLAAAVQIIAYEVQCALQALQVPTILPYYDDLADGESIERFFQHLIEVLIKIEFYDPQNPQRLIPRLRRLFNRIRLEKMEVAMLRGILTAVSKKNAFL